MSEPQAMERGLPRGYLRAVLLVLVAPGPTHGYELLEQVREVGIRVADPGGLYRTLRAMDQHGLFESWWEDSSSGPPRRTYALTAAGRETLEAEIEAIRATVDLLTDLVDSAERVVGLSRRPR